MLTFQKENFADEWSYLFQRFEVLVGTGWTHATGFSSISWLKGRLMAVATGSSSGQAARVTYTRHGDIPQR